jgi:hypothetical protein
MRCEGSELALHRSASLGVRLRGLAVAGGCAGVLALAAVSAPPDGRDGLFDVPACSFRVTTGYPCPTCGMTTSLSAAMSGRLWDSARAHAFGLALAAGLAMWAGAGIAELATGRPAIQRLRPGMWWAVAGVAGVLVGWAITLGVGFTRGNLPVR